jgi:thioredoxin reductase
MADVIVIGDGPGGLSAALFLAKNGMEVVVYGEDKTAMHAAFLKNYLGILEVLGSDFQKTAREQVLAHGARIEAKRVSSLAKDGTAFEATLADGEKVRARYVILSEGKSPRLAQMLGLSHDAAKGLAADKNARTAVDGVYAVGRLVRPGRSQAIISAGDGAAAAIDILSREKGEDFSDWDTP